MRRPPLRRTLSNLRDSRDPALGWGDIGAALDHGVSERRGIIDGAAPLEHLIPINDQHAVEYSLATNWTCLGHAGCAMDHMIKTGPRLETYR